ncbi:hypothetical protein [Pseudomonas canadensis]|uniref:hypothetical protein n=1 Tax=Pseudomonas canadensis TaxID=915099 RepID=UPI000F4A7DC7|nr:hypothetical protein [Pseudomonas canadensis]
MSNLGFLFSAKKLKPAILLAIFFTMEASAKTTLEEQFRGIESCNIKNIFLDQVSHKPSGEYFSERKLEPCRIDEVAFYCVSDTFYRLHVNQIAILYIGPFSVHAIYLKESPGLVESALRAQFKNIRLNQGDGNSPILISDPQQPGGSIFYCDEYSE